MVLSTTLLVSLLGLTGLLLVRIESRKGDLHFERQIARNHSRSAVELALRVLATDPGWRTAYASGVETAPQSLGPNAAGSVSWNLEDSDGSLADADTQLRLKGVGRVRDTVQVSSVQVIGPPRVLDSLQCSIYALGNVSQAGSSRTNLGPFASAASFAAAGNVTGSVEGNPVQVTGSVSGTVTDPGPRRGVPDSSVWDTYATLATNIPYVNFPSVDSTTREMSRRLLSRNVNPFGVLDAEGVYRIQVPAGRKLNISRSRIHATLLIELGENAAFQVLNSCLWDPPAGWNHPAMIARGTGTANIVFSTPNNFLREQTPAPRINFNPRGDPYNGATDNDQNDRYTPLCRGLYHVIGPRVHSVLSSNFRLTGTWISEGTVNLGAVTATVDANLFSSPPLGYTLAPADLQVVSGSWWWDAAP
jgi:hypothetical protein